MLKFIASDKPYSTAKRYFITGAFWGMIGALYGVLSALALIAPDFISGIAQFTFGRMRPVHVSTVAIGFVYSLLLGAGAYFVPRLLKVEGLWNEKLGNISVWIWNILLLGGLGTLLHGQTQARELAEWVFWIDVLVAVSLGIYAINIYMTIIKRKQPTLYVSVWYVAGGIIWTLTVYFLGNIMFLPLKGTMTGFTDQIWLWFYGHNVVGLILTPMAVATAYWIIPRAVKKPVWSHNLSLIGFWVLLVIYTHTGTHHLIQAPAPQWLKIISIVDSVALIIPVFAVLLNLWLPMKGRLAALHDNIGAKFAFVGTIWYAIVCLQGPLQSLPSVQRLTHFTHWVVAHAHIAILGFAGFIAMGAAYTIVPLIVGKKLYSQKLADIHYWTIVIGLINMFFFLTAAGLVQGSGWLNGESMYRIVSQMQVYHITRAIAGMAMLISLIIFFYNIIRTIYQKDEATTEVAK